MNAKSMEKKRERRERKGAQGNIYKTHQKKRKKLSKGSVFWICIRKKEGKKKGTKCPESRHPGKHSKRKLSIAKNPVDRYIYSHG